MKIKRALKLSVKRSQFRVDDPHSEASDKEFRKVRDSILVRDKYTCQYCGFYSEKYQEIHHLDDDHSNNDESNLITTCPICHMCNHLTFAGLNKMGVMIYLGDEIDISQAQLNAFIRQLWIAEQSDDNEIKIAAQAYKSRLYQQVVPAMHLIGDSKPDMLGNFMSKLSNDDYEKRDKKLKNIYFLADIDGFKKQFTYWSQRANKNFPSSKWSNSSKIKIEKWLKNEYGLEACPENIARYIKTKQKEIK